MRTRPGCQEASSEPRWCRRGSLPASGLRGPVGAGGSQALPAERRPHGLGSHSPTGHHPALAQEQAFAYLRLRLPWLLAGRSRATSLVQFRPMGRLSLSQR